MFTRVLIFTTMLVLFSGCNNMPQQQSTHLSPLAESCQQAIARLDQQLGHSTEQQVNSNKQEKIASLLQAARIQYEFGEYQLCLQNTQRVQQHLSSLQGSLVSSLQYQL